MPPRPRTTPGKVIIGLGRGPGVAAAITRLRDLLAEVDAGRESHDPAALLAVRDRAHSALGETAAQAADVPALQEAHDALQAALPALERHLAAVNGPGPQVGGHRPSPAAHDMLDQEDAHGDAPSGGYGRVEPVTLPPDGEGATAPDDAALSATGYGQIIPATPEQLAEIHAPSAEDGRVEPVALPPDEEGAAVVDDAALRATGYGQIIPATPEQLAEADAPPVEDDPRAAQHTERRADPSSTGTPSDSARRAQTLAEYLARELKGNAKLLTTEERRAFVKEFNRAVALVAPAEQADALAALRREVDAVAGKRLALISALMSDMSRIEPLTTHALALLAAAPEQRDAHAQLEQDWESLRSTLETQTDLEKARKALGKFETKVKEALRGVSLDSKRAAQAASLNQDPDKPLAIGKALGAGNFGLVVDLGVDADGRALVGKTRNPRVDETRFRQEIEHEEKIYAQVGAHPNIARCHGIQRIGSEEVLVMEKVEGPKLDAVFSKLEVRYRKGEIGREQYMGALQQLIKGTLQGLAQFEAMGVTHRDIKADNIMLDEATMQPKLVDMGLAQAHGPQQNATIMLSTTPPEVLAGSGGVDAKWDSFTVGKMLFPQTELAPAMHDPRRATETVTHYEFVPGLKDAQPAHFRQGAYLPNRLTSQDIREAAKAAVIKKPDGSFGARVGPDGEYTGLALRPTDASSAQPGQFGMDSAYVDFMNRLTHPDPKLRMSASEALRHPFLTQQLGDPDKLAGALGLPPPEAPEAPEAREVEEVGEATEPMESVSDTNVASDDEDHYMT